MKGEKTKSRCDCKEIEKKRKNPERSIRFCVYFNFAVYAGARALGASVRICNGEVFVKWSAIL